MAVPRGATDPQKLLDKAIAAADVIEILRLLDDANLDLDRRDVGHDLQTPLMRMCHMLAASDSLDGVLEKLETCAWNPNVQDATGRTLLMHACIADRLNVVLLCLDNGCDVDLTDVDGNSALVYAVRNGSVEIVNCFLETEECRSLLCKTNNFGQCPECFSLCLCLSLSLSLSLSVSVCLCSLSLSVSLSLSLSFFVSVCLSLSVCLSVCLCVCVCVCVCLCLSE